ncbi:MAG: endonuclease/exonuclease/phosphatase family protein [Actinomycetes bacterium]
MRLRGVAATVIGATSMALLAPHSAQAAEPTVTVMSRNIYLGADVGVALDLIPDMPAAAQFMWDQVNKNDFSKRSVALATEIKTYKPDVIGLQEATIWYCKKNAWSKQVEVFNFTEQLLKALGGDYVLASKDGVTAFNPGFSISPIPFLTIVKDPERFQKLFGQDKAACGFQIGDALAIKKELTDQVIKVGNTEYEASYSIVPTLMTIYRGYTWADINIANIPVRFVTTHLESTWDENKVPNSAKQASQLIQDVKEINMPLVVIGDFNSDPRDPRPANGANPGSQPTASEECPAGDSKCNAYRLMVDAGFNDAGPDSSDPSTYTWGMNALLTGPDPDRLNAAQSMGNEYGFTDRLDYIFTKNGVDVSTSQIIGFKTPYATDHAGVFAKFTILNTLSGESEPLPENKPFPISFWQWIGIALLALMSWKIVNRIRR